MRPAPEARPPAELLAALDALGAEPPSWQCEGARYFGAAGPWFARFTLDQDDPPRLAYERQARAAVAAAAPAPAVLRTPAVVAAGAAWVVEERIPVAPGIATSPDGLTAVVRAATEVSRLALPARLAPSGESNRQRLQRQVGMVVRGLARDAVAAKRIMAAPGLPEGAVHGDFHPRNVFVGDGAVWVIDWELCGRGPVGLDALRYWCSLDDAAAQAVFWDALVAEVGAEHQAALRRLRYAVVVQTLAGAAAKAAHFDRDPVLADRLSRLLPAIRV